MVPDKNNVVNSHFVIRIEVLKVEHVKSSDYKSTETKRYNTQIADIKIKGGELELAKDQIINHVNLIQDGDFPE